MKVWRHLFTGPILTCPQTCLRSKILHLCEELSPCFEVVLVSSYLWQNTQALIPRSGVMRISVFCKITLLIFPHLHSSAFHQLKPGEVCGSGMRRKWGITVGLRCASKDSSGSLVIAWYSRTSVIHIPVASILPFFGNTESPLWMRDVVGYLCYNMSSSKPSSSRFF